MRTPGARVILELPRPLMGLLKGLAGVGEFVEFVVKGDALPAFDFHCPLLSLPLALHIDFGSIPASPLSLRRRHAPCEMARPTR